MLDFHEDGLLEETLTYNSQHTTKFEFYRQELRVRLLFWFLVMKKVSSSLQNTSSAPSDSKAEKTVLKKVNTE